LGRDPIEEDVGYNLYTFVRNKTLNGADRYGLAETTASPATVKNWLDAKKKLENNVNYYIQYVLKLTEQNNAKNPFGKVINKGNALESIHQLLTSGADQGGNNTLIARSIQKAGYAVQGKYKGSIYEGGLKVPSVTIDLLKYFKQWDGLIEHKIVTADGKWTEGALATSHKIVGLPIGSDKIDHMFYDGWKIRNMSHLRARLWNVAMEGAVYGFVVVGQYCPADNEANMMGKKFYNDLDKALKDHFENGNAFTYMFKLENENKLVETTNYSLPYLRQQIKNNLKIGIGK